MKMRTSASQFNLLVEYMERNGDLSKPTEGPHGRATNIQLWAELTNLLNADATGDTKSSEKWRKVWSDFKNNTKKKAAKIHRAAQGTGGGPASNLRLTTLEERVLSLIGTQAATGMVNIPEAGLEEEVIVEIQPETRDSLFLSDVRVQPDQQETYFSTEDWNRPGGSNQAPVFPPLPVAGISKLGQPEVSSSATVARAPQGMALEGRSETSGGVPPAGRPAPSPGPASTRRRTPQSPTPLPHTPRRRRRGRLPDSPIHRRTRTQTQSDLARQAFVRSDSEWRAFQQETEQERSRLREAELQNQERWLDLFAQFLALGNRIADIFEKK